MILTGGERHDVTQAEDLLSGVKAKCVIADKGYDADDIVKTIESLGAEAVIPCRSNRKEQRMYDEEKYKERNIIERLFLKLKHYRGLSTRYEKLAVNYISLVYFAAIFVWLR